MKIRFTPTARAVAAALVTLASGCSPSDVLSVPAPTGVLPASSFQSQSGAEQVEDNGIAYLAQGFEQDEYGVLEWSGLLTDEFYWGDFTYSGGYAGVDARQSEGIRGFQEPADYSIQALMAARLTILTAIPLLEKYEPAGGRSKIGLAFAVLGYTELLAAEDFCAGLPLASPTPSGVAYGTPLTTDSLLGVAEADFDSAAAYAAGDPTVVPLAAVGLARTRLNRANYAGAASAVASVSTSFVYGLYLEAGGYNSGGLTTSNLFDYDVQYGDCGETNVANRKGENGLNYVTANDPRLVFNTTLIETCDGAYAGFADSVYYYPVKFGNPSSSIPLATGVEARLIEAEAALSAGQIGAWAADLNALRANAPTTYLALTSAMPPLPADSTTSATTALQVDVMFRERAFWTFGMDMRLGDMRRLIRQYGRNSETVFPTGPYPFGSISTLPAPLPNYGTDVSLTLPTNATTLTDPNHNYKGCISKAA
jgi:starch-binding outer membrane protein, SusD/RagB family